MSVFEFHETVEHILEPILTVAVGSTIAKLKPSTVIVEPDDVGTLRTLYDTTGASYEKALVSVPIIPESVISTILPVLEPYALWRQSTVVEVCHEAVPQLDDPIAMDAVASSFAKL